MQSIRAYLQSTQSVSLTCAHVTCYCMAAQHLNGKRRMGSFKLENPTWPTSFIVPIKASLHPLSHPFDLSLFVCLQVFQPQLQQCRWVSPEQEVMAQPASEYCSPTPRPVPHTNHESIGISSLYHQFFFTSDCVRLGWRHSTIHCPCCLLPFNAQRNVHFV